jgi:TetR/AcrR family transcriptional regulator, tetracycline repressor protein
VKTAAGRTKPERTGRPVGRPPLTRERVIEAALRVMDREGLEAVTMRRIGRELGVEAMSLYNHVEDKDDILGGVTEMAMGEFRFPEPSGDWRIDARAMAHEWRRLLTLHPPLCQLLAERHRPLEGLAAFRAMDAALGLLRASGLPDRDAAEAFNALGSYILGFVVMEQGLMLGQDDAHAQRHEQAMQGIRIAGLDHVVACLPYFAECAPDLQFEFGLELMLRGIEAAARTARETAS